MRSNASFVRRPGLILPAMLGPAVETALLGAFGSAQASSLGPQLTAPPPFDLFHDLRWISVYHNSWVTLTLELIAMLALRSLWVAWMVQRSWPDDPRPSLGPAAKRTVVFYAVGSVLMAPWVVLLFGLAVTHLSYLFFSALPPMLAIALLIHRGALAQAAGHWWRWRPSWRSIAWSAGTFACLTVAGGVISSTRGAVPVAVAAVAGLWNARAYLGIVSDITQVRVRARPLRQRLVPVALATTFVVVVGGVQAGFSATLHGGSAKAAPPAAIPIRADGYPVLVAAGYSSRWTGTPVLQLPHGFVAWRYSYLGVDEQGRLLPYGPTDTLQPLMTSASRMAEQVRALYRAYRKPVTIVAESEGGLVARTFLVQLYEPGAGLVDRLVILDVPKADPSVFYPKRGDQGWGVGSGWGLRGLALFVRAVSEVPVSADAPLVRDLVDCRLLVAKVAGSPLPFGVHETSIHALADAVDDRYLAAVPGVTTQVVTAAHGGLAGRDGVQEEIFRILTEESATASSSTLALARFVAAASGPWLTPGLAASLAPPASC